MVNPIKSPFFLGLVLFHLLHVDIAAARQLKNNQNPFTPRSYLIRYWNKQVSQTSPKSQFLVSKASPLNAIDAARFARLAEQNTLSQSLVSFCSAANLFCFPDSLAKSKHNPHFADYTNKTFSNYGTGLTGGLNSFQNYSQSQNTDGNDNLPFDSFNQYSRHSNKRDDKFTGYGSTLPNDTIISSNDIHQRFTNYGNNATHGSGDFKNYVKDVNIPDLQFKSYSDHSGHRPQSFTSYAKGDNIGNLSFTSYGKQGNGDPTLFASYSETSNVVTTDFKGYGESATGANDTFTNYADGANDPRTKFNSYGQGGQSGVQSFIHYNEMEASGQNSFESYSKSSRSEKVNFLSYEETPLPIKHKFTEYGQNADGQQIRFDRYQANPDYKTYNEFKGYAKKGVTFAGYNSTGEKKDNGSTRTSMTNKLVEAGRFFRESMLKQGSVMPMPDIRDKMPERSFLPRAIVSKLPFASSKLGAMKEIFHAEDDSSMEHIMKEALNDCEREPSVGETKRCVGSAEDMIDFATSVLSRHVALRTTDNVEGSKKDIVIGKVKGINGGQVTKSVSCHQSLYPYLMYYCHSVPKVRVYEVDILDSQTKVKINHGVAICHLDTSAWSPTHGAFVALGSSPGHIEVCHWIFENDLTWTIAD